MGGGRKGRPTCRERSWKYVGRKVLREFSEDQCTDQAAALTYYAVLAIFPAVLALTSILGLVHQADAVNTVLDVLKPLVAPSTYDTIAPVVRDLGSSQSAGLTLVIGLAGALWSASGYVGAFGRAMNRVYEIEEGRPFWKLRPLMLLITLVAVVLSAAVLLMLVVSGPRRHVDRQRDRARVRDGHRVAVRQVARAARHGDAHRRDALLRDPQREAAEVPLDLGRRRVRDRHLGASPRWASRSTSRASAATTRPTARWPASSSPCCGCGSPTSPSCSAPRSTRSSSAVASCEAGIPAEAELQLPPRDTRNIEKAREKEEKDIELGRQIRAQADGGEVGEEYDDVDDPAGRANLATHRSTTPSGGTS